MRNLIKSALKPELIFALLIAFIAYVFTSFYFQNISKQVLIQGVFQQDAEVILRSIGADNHVVVFDRFLIKGNKSPKPKQYRSKVKNLPVEKLSIEFISAFKGDEIREISLSQIQVIKPYQNHYYYGGDVIQQVFTSEQSVLDRKNTFAYSPTSNSIVITSISNIGERNWFLISGITVLFFICSLALARRVSISSLPAFKDMSLGYRISSNGEFDAINGLRGLAALLVLFSHTAPGFESVQVGLALLFVISGFLLSKPFVLDTNKILSVNNIEHYIVKRLKRILPMYYLYIFLIYVLNFELDTALRHFFFVQSAGHLWPMTQIFAFYMMLPIILVITTLAYKLNRFIPLVILVVSIYLSLTLMSSWKPFYNGLYSHQFYLYAFLMGILASYVQYDLIKFATIFTWGKRWSRELLGLVAAVMTFYIIAWSAPMKPSPVIFHWVSQFWVKCFVSVLILLLVINTPKTVFRWLISNWLFRSVGVIGFSFYILHGLGMQIFKHIQIHYLASVNPGVRSWEFMLGAFVISYIMSVITYSYVERPFFGVRGNEKKDK